MPPRPGALVRALASGGGTLSSFLAAWSCRHASGSAALRHPTAVLRRDESRAAPPAPRTSFGRAGGRLRRADAAAGSGPPRPPRRHPAKVVSRKDSPLSNIVKKKHKAQEQADVAPTGGGTSEGTASSLGGGLDPSPTCSIIPRGGSSPPKDMQLIPRGGSQDPPLGMVLHGPAARL